MLGSARNANIAGGGARRQHEIVEGHGLALLKHQVVGLPVDAGGRCLADGEVVLVLEQGAHWPPHVFGIQRAVAT